MDSQVAFDAFRANADRIPRAHVPPFAVGGYVNGAITSFQWRDTEWALFPDSYHIRINVTGEPHRGNALDVENGDATPASVEPWITSVRDSPDPLLVYCNRSNVNACQAARDAAHKATGVFAFLWVATLDGNITQHAMTQFGQIKINGTVVADVSLITDRALLSLMALRIGKQQ